MPLDPAVLLGALRAAGHPLGLQDLIRRAQLPPARRSSVDRTLAELVRSGAVRRQGKRFALAQPVEKSEPRPVAGVRHGRGGALREGRLTVNERGFGFVDVGEEEEDVFLPPHQAAKGLHGDRVLVRVHARGGRTEAELVEVLERQRAELVGIYQVRGGEAWVQPHETSIPGMVRVPPTQLAQDGDVVRVRLAPPSGIDASLSGDVMGSLGKPGDPSQDVLALVVARGFSDSFPAPVMDEAARVGERVSEEEARGEHRRDLRGLELVTIDGADARDFDDAVWAEPVPGGTRLVVAIADVSHYVRPGTALDTEAYHRGTSVYLPDRVLPMLPERLSNGICSLRPGEDRLCLVADMVFGEGAVRQSATLYPAVMRSSARCTYDEVQSVLDRVSVPGRDGFLPLFRRLATLASGLRRMREARGALDFDLPETRVVVDPATGRPVRMERRERKESHRLVEECMLAANEAVAAFFQGEGLPSVYRFHGEPDEAKLEAFAELARAHGLKVPGGRRPSSLELNRFIQELEGKPEQRALNQVLLRSMMQAVYSPDSVGHYGLAADEYLHFTSPIRRYPDLLVHRLLRAHWQRRGTGRGAAELEREVATLRTMAARASERERAAMQVERDVTSFYSALLMEPRVGETFAATVSGVADFGVFVELDTEHVEGLIRADALGNRSRFDQRQHAMVLGDGRRVRVGQAATVQLKGVSLARRQIDFALVDWGTGAADLEPGADAAHPGFDRRRPGGTRPGSGGRARPERTKTGKQQPPRSGSTQPARGGGRAAAPRSGQGQHGRTEQIRGGRTDASHAPRSGRPEAQEHARAGKSRQQSAARGGRQGAARVGQSGRTGTSPPARGGRSGARSGQPPGTGSGGRGRRRGR